MGEHHKLLIVDDEPLNVELLEEMLRAEGYATDSARNGYEALSRLAEAPQAYSAVLLDRLMPGMDGMEVLAQIRADERLKPIPVIFQTAKTAKEDIIEGFKAGAYYYATKPLDRGPLLDVVKAAVADHDLHVDLADRVHQMVRTVSRLRLMRQGRFELRTLAEARELAPLLAYASPEPDRVVLGLSELLINAVEHGNLGITYEDKSRLNSRGEWQAEIERRQSLPENAAKRVSVDVSVSTGFVRYRIRDEGRGFDAKRYLEIDRTRAFDSHGRGIAIANAVCFDGIAYEGCGNTVEASVGSDLPEPPRATARAGASVRQRELSWGPIPMSPQAPPATSDGFRVARLGRSVATLPIRSAFLILALGAVTAGVSIANAAWILGIHGSRAPVVNLAQLPLYGFLKAPETALDADVRGRLGVDFLQVYAGARHFFDERTIYDRRRDFFDRLPTYPPLTHFLYVPLATRYPPEVAVQIHLWLQVAALFLATFLVLGRRGWAQALAACAIEFAFVFCSPVGLNWAERGQFSLYPATAFVFALGAILRRKPVHFVLCGAFAALKWSSLPFLFVALALYVLEAKSGDSIRWAHAGSVGLVLVASLAAFPVHSIEYLGALRTLELGEAPAGISLVQVLPTWLGKLLPLALVVAGVPFLSWTRAARGEGCFEVARMAVWIGACLLLSMYGTNAFDYRTLVLLAFVPTFFVWLDDPAHAGWSPGLRAWRNLVVLGLPLLLAVALRLILRDVLFERWARTVWLLVGLALAYFALAVAAPFVDRLGEPARIAGAPASEAVSGP